MRMLTKQWYQTMTDSGLGVCLEIDDRAAESSDGVFQAVWAEKLAAWLQMRAEICPILEEEFDEAGERQRFEEYYAREMEDYRIRTPGKILEKVADIRLLALGICTEEVYRDFADYRALCQKWTEKTMKEAWNMRRCQGLEDAWTGEHSLHDAFVLSLNREGEDLIIEFEVEDPEERLADIRENDPELLEEMGEAHFLFPEIKAIRFRDAEILKQEQPLENAWWLYDEIWRTEEGTFEIHALLWRNDDLFELTDRKSVV